MRNKKRATGTKSIVESFESVREDVAVDGRTRETARGETKRKRDVSLPRLKTEYGNKSEAGRKGKVSRVSNRCTYVALLSKCMWKDKDAHVLNRTLCMVGRLTFLSQTRVLRPFSGHIGSSTVND